MRPSFATFPGDFLGAFADTALLFPILILLALKAGFSLPLLLISSGVLYLAAGLLFRLPMPVQPLKSVAISAVSLGAGKQEILAAALIIGAFFFLLLVFNRHLLRLPEESIRCVQWGLGLLLILQGLGGEITHGGGLPRVLLLSAILLLSMRVHSWPWLGLFAFLAFLSSFSLSSFSLSSFSTSGATGIPAASVTGIRWTLVASLVLPQLALTSANSVLGTELAVRAYFPDQNPSRFRPRLLFSIGAGNLLMGLIGGLPFCHGSGGLTAHYRAGARTALMNAVMGSTLIGLGFLAHHGVTAGALPAIPGAAILLTVGVLHLGLARSLFTSRSGMLLLLLTTGLTLFSRNLLLVLAGALVFQLLSASGRTREVAP